MASQQVVVRLPHELAEALFEAATALKRSRSELVRDALRDFLFTRKAERRPADRAAHHIGCLESGVPDLAEHHRRYVLESLRRGS